MAFLAVCGVEPSVLAGSGFEETPRDIGETEDAFDGTPKVSRQREVRDVSLEVGPYIQADAFAWDQLFRGAGQHFSFDSHTYGSKGLAQYYGPNSSIDSSEKKHGAASLKVTTSDSHAYRGSGIFSAAGELTMMVFRQTTPGGGFTHYIQTRSRGAAYANWTNGASKAAGNLSWVTMDTSNNEFALISGGTHWFDDLVLLPYVVPDGWVASLYSWHASNAWPQLPLLTVTGDAIPEASSRSVLGRVNRHRLVQAAIDGTFVSTGRVLSVSLQGA